MTFADQVRAALAEGRRAAETRQPPRPNPYRTTGSTPPVRERVLARAWRAGYSDVTAAFPVDYTG